MTGIGQDGEGLVSAEMVNLVGWLAESAQRATGPSQPGEEDRLRARRDGLLAAVEDRVRRECAGEVRAWADEFLGRRDFTDEDGYPDYMVRFATRETVLAFADRLAPGSGRTSADGQG